MKGLQPDFKWFGDGFDGFPKFLPEDCVEYRLYIIDTNLKDSEVRSKLRQVEAAGNNLTRNLLREFIWQREGFKLELIQDKGRKWASSLLDNSETNLFSLTRFNILTWTNELWRLC